MKTKPIILATAGSTVDGRNIDDAFIEGMAKSYDPKTYTARANIEHIRGISPDKPFNAKGDVLELSVGEVDVNFSGKTEKRKALYGVVDLNDDAVAMVKAGQKVFPSVEIEPNFAGKGFPYLMGLALTDSPASIATERMQFNRQIPGTIRLDGDTAFALESAEDEGNVSEDGKGFLKSLSGVLDGFAAKFSAAKTEEKPEAKPDAPQPLGVEDIKAIFTSFGEETNKVIVALATKTSEDIAAISQKFTALEAKIEGTPSQQHNSRPPANGGANYSKTDC